VSAKGGRDRRKVDSEPLQDAQDFLPTGYLAASFWQLVDTTCCSLVPRATSVWSRRQGEKNLWMLLQQIQGFSMLPYFMMPSWECRQFEISMPSTA